MSVAPASAHPRGCAVIPAYQEERLIAEVVQHVRQHLSNVIVVDDGSGDATAREAARAGAVVLRHEVNRGKGVALQTGFAYAREHGFEFVITLDADGQNDPRDIPTLLAALRLGVDSVTGIRTRRQDTWVKRLSSRVANPFAGIAGFEGTAFISGANTTRSQLLRPYPHFGGVTSEEPIGYSWYHSLQSRLEKRFSKGYTFQLSYTWSKLMEALSFRNPTDEAVVAPRPLSLSALAREYFPAGWSDRGQSLASALREFGKSLGDRLNKAGPTKYAATPEPTAGQEWETIIIRGQKLDKATFIVSAADSPM